MSRFCATAIFAFLAVAGFASGEKGRCFDLDEVLGENEAVMKKCIESKPVADVNDYLQMGAVEYCITEGTDDIEEEGKANVQKHYEAYIEHFMADSGVDKSEIETILKSCSEESGSDSNLTEEQFKEYFKCAFGQIDILCPRDLEEWLKTLGKNPQDHDVLKEE